jgi:hypothetical protein
LPDVRKVIVFDDGNRREYFRYYKRRRVHPYMNAIWYQNAERLELANAGYMYDTPWRGVLHTTEGKSAAGAIASYKGNRSTPHFTVTFETGSFKVYQHIPIDKAARSLVNKYGGIETNRTRCIQVEIVGSANSIASISDEYVHGIGSLMRWIESNTTIQRTAPTFKAYPASYGANNGVRFTPEQWSNFNGWCGHQHVPENDHGDPGNIPIQKLFAVETGVKPMYDPPLPLVSIRQDPYGGVIGLGQDGGIYNWFGSLFFGTPAGQPYWGNHKAAEVKFGKEFLPTELPWYNYRYVVVATNGDKYGFGQRV